MKNRAEQKANYSKLIRRIYLNLFITATIAIALVIIFRMITRGKIGDAIVEFLQRSFRLNWNDAQRIYQYALRDNYDILFLIAFVICFLALSHFLLYHFTKYFNEISSGIDALITGDENEIELSEEISFMSKKLNTLKQALEKRERDAKISEQRKNDVVMYLAHDIKTPLTSVIGYLNLLEEAPDMPAAQQAKYMRIALDKAYRLEQLIDEFFEITRFNLQAISLSQTHVDLYYMLMQLADEFYPQLATHGKRVVVHAPEDLSIFGDPEKLARVFNNILKNAIAYSEPNGIIEITAALSQDIVSLEFRNTGSIPPDKLTSIFEKFYRLDDARSTDTGGAGLGLAIAKEIVQQHGGRIRGDSSDGYTTFTVELPAPPTSGSSAQPKPVSPS